jgi:hypothetical protein
MTLAPNPACRQPLSRTKSAGGTHHRRRGTAPSGGGYHVRGISGLFEATRLLVSVRPGSPPAGRTPTTGRHLTVVPPPEYVRAGETKPARRWPLPLRRAATLVKHPPRSWELWLWGYSLKQRLTSRG